MSNGTSRISISNTLAGTQWATALVVSVVTGLISLGAGVLGGEWAVKLILLYSTLLISTVVWIVFRHLNIDQSINDLKTSVQSDQLSRDLLPIAQDPSFRAIKDALLSSLSSAKDIETRFSDPEFAKLLQGARSFSQEQAIVALKQFADPTIPLNQDQEAVTNAIFLRALPKVQIRAISYFDENWWQSDQGKNFLDEHRAPIERGLKIERIFVLRDAVQDGTPIQAILDEQKKRNIQVRTVLEADIRNKAPAEDFVIYDEDWVRYASLADLARTAYEDKTAVLTHASEAVEKYILKYSSIRSCSREYMPQQQSKQ